EINVLAPLLLLLALLGGPSAGLEVQHKFLSPTLTNNFALDGLGSKIYLAAVNRLYQLSGPNLTLEVEEQVGPVPDNPLCHAPQLPQASCEHPKVLTNNYNKILQPDPEQGIVVVCGSIYQGFCQLRSMANISAVAVSFPPGGAGGGGEPVTVFPSMLNIAANHPNASTVGLVLRPAGPAGGGRPDTRLLVGIAIRALNARGDLAKLFTFDLNPSDDNIFKIKQGAKARHKLSFVRAFLQPAPPPRGPGGAAYAYLALNSEANAGDKESHSHSLLARICLAEPGRNSYIQLGLQCGAGFTRLVSVFPATAALQLGPPAAPQPQELLFGVFERAAPPGARQLSALCAFRFADIERSIRQARNSLGRSAQSRFYSKCVCGGNPVCFTYRGGQLRTLVFSGLTSVAVSSVNNYTVVFLGTANGRLLKVKLNRVVTTCVLVKCQLELARCLPKLPWQFQLDTFASHPTNVMSHHCARLTS
uniref:Sema domain-containing protein n=1 Tax=Gopherus evgoodei TaxID=1825980 RepID=A0A8C4W5P8_9SAUR